MSPPRLLGVATTAALPLAAAACVFSASVLQPDPIDGQGGASGAGGADTATSAATGSTGDAGTGGFGVVTSSSNSSVSGTTSGSSGSGGSTSSSSGSGGTTDGCANPADQMILADNNAMLQAAQDCALTCGGGGACASACMVMNKQISAACGACWGDFIGCAAANCAFPCGSNPTGSNCKNCTATNQCDSAYHQCAGV